MLASPVAQLLVRGKRFSDVCLVRELVQDPPRLSHATTNDSALLRRAAAILAASWVMRMVLSSAAATAGAPSSSARWRSWWRLWSTHLSSRTSACTRRRRVCGGS